MYPIYLNNDLATASYKTEDNLRTLTKLYDNGKRTQSQVFAMLRGLGVTEQMAKYAVENYMQNTNKKNIATMRFTLENLTNLLLGLKGQLATIKESNINRINYAADASTTIVEGILSNIYNYLKVFEQIKEADTPEKAIDAAGKINSTLTKIKPEIYYAVNVVESLSKYKNIIAVSQLLEVINEFLSANAYTTQLTQALFKINNAIDSNYYSDCSEDIVNLLKHDEQYIKENLSIVLNKHAWIPLVKLLLENYSQRTKKYVSNSDATVERVYSPVLINEDKSVTLYLDNNFYKIQGNIFEQITDYKQLNREFYGMCSVLETFKIEENELTLYKPNTSLTLVIESKGIKINNVHVDKTNVTGLRNNLIASGFYRIDEIHKVEKLIQLLENYDKIKEIDIITRLVGKNGNIINIVKLDENNIYINRFNKLTGNAEVYKVNNYSEAQSIVNEYFNFDISRSMENLIENDKKYQNKLIDQKNELENRVKFLTEKIDFLTKQNIQLNDINIEGAVTVLKEDRRTFEIDLQRIYEKLAETTK